MRGSRARVGTIWTVRATRNRAVAEGLTNSSLGLYAVICSAMDLVLITMFAALIASDRSRRGKSSGPNPELGT